MDAPQDPQRRANNNEEGSNYQSPPVYRAPEVVRQPVPQTLDSQSSYSQAGEAHVETKRQSYFDPAGNLVEKQEQIVDDPYQRRFNLVNRSTQIIYFVLGLVEVMLGLRFLLRLIDAEATTGFTSFIYNFTNPFVVPFNGIFNDQTLNRGGILELSTVVAMVIYALVAYGIAKLLYVVFAPNRSSGGVYTKTRRRQF